MEKPPPYEPMKELEPCHTLQQQYPQPQQPYPQSQQPNPQPQQSAVNAPIQNNINVNAAAPASHTVIIQGQVRPSSYMGLACCTIWCCNPLVGIIAFIFSMLSSSAADDNDLPRARTMGRVSMGFSIASMIITVVLVGIIVGVTVNDDKNDYFYG